MANGMYADPRTGWGYCEEDAPEGAVEIPIDDVTASTLPMQTGPFTITCATCDVELYDATVPVDEDE